jgi:hypothetical protein
MSTAGRCALVAFLWVGLGVAAPLQDTRLDAPRIVLAVKGAKSLKGKTTLAPHTVEVESQDVIAIHIPDDENDEFTLTGRKVGSTRLTVIDKDGKKETIEVVVRVGKWIPVDTSIPLKLSSAKPLRAFAAENDKIVRVQAVKGDPNAVEVVGLTAGETGVKLTAEDGTAETIQCFAVKCDHVVAVGESVAVRMRIKGQYCSVDTPNPEVGEIGVSKDRRDVVFKATAPGVAVVQFTGPAAGIVLDAVVVGVKPKGK